MFHQVSIFLKDDWGGKGKKEDEKRKEGRGIGSANDVKNVGGRTPFRREAQKNKGGRKGELSRRRQVLRLRSRLGR